MAEFYRLFGLHPQRAGVLIAPNQYRKARDVIAFEGAVLKATCLMDAWNDRPHDPPERGCYCGIHLMGGEAWLCLVAHKWQTPGLVYAAAEPLGRVIGLARKAGNGQPVAARAAGVRLLRLWFPGEHHCAACIELHSQHGWSAPRRATLDALAARYQVPVSIVAPVQP